MFSFQYKTRTLTFVTKFENIQLKGYVYQIKISADRGSLFLFVC